MLVHETLISKTEAETFNLETETLPSCSRRDRDETLGTSRDRDVETETTSLVGGFDNYSEPDLF